MLELSEYGRGKKAYERRHQEQDTTNMIRLYVLQNMAMSMLFRPL